MQQSIRHQVVERRDSLPRGNIVKSKPKDTIKGGLLEEGTENLSRLPKVLLENGKTSDCQVISGKVSLDDSCAIMDAKGATILNIGFAFVSVAVVMAAG